MIQVELTLGVPYRQKTVSMPAVPREGDRVVFDDASGTVSRVSWLIDDAGLTTIRVGLI